MTVLTAANQLTLLRLLLVPVFAIFMLYGLPGWALVTFAVAAVTDALDGIIARHTQPTTLGAWLDPMADKFLLTTMFVMLSIPGLGSVQRIPLWLDCAGVQSRRRDRAHGRHREPRRRAPDLPSVVPRQGRDRHLHGHRRRDALRELHRPSARGRDVAGLCLAGADVALSARVHADELSTGGLVLGAGAGYLVRQTGRVLKAPHAPALA